MNDIQKAEDLFNEGLELTNEGRFEEAIEAFNQALELAPDNLSVKVNLSTALQEAGRHLEAIAILEQIIQLNKGLSDEYLGLIYYNWGNALRERKSDLEAIEKYLLAIEKRPNHASTWYNLGQCWWRTGNHEKAAEAYSNAVRLNPNHNEAKARLELMNMMLSSNKMREFERKTKEPSKGCFVVTAIYGSQYAPEVLYLKRFRDECLTKTGPGRSMIRLYYLIGPALAEGVKNHPFIRSVIKRIFIEPIISLIKRKGSI